MVFDAARVGIRGPLHLAFYHAYVRLWEPVCCRASVCVRACVCGPLLAWSTELSAVCEGGRPIGARRSPTTARYQRCMHWHWHARRSRAPDRTDSEAPPQKRRATARDCAGGSPSQRQGARGRPRARGRLLVTRCYARGCSPPRRTHAAAAHGRQTVCAGASGGGDISPAQCSRATPDGMDSAKAPQWLGG